MEEAIREFGKKLSKTDVGLFYFSGHGVQYKGENYLLPINDTGITDTTIKYKTVPVGIVLEEMTNAGNRLNIVILDACRNYPSSWSKSAVRGLAQMKADSGMLIAYATSPDSTASDGSGRNGTYTANLLKNMATPGLHLLMFFQEVRKATLTDSGNQQRPWESVSITDDFYFVSASPPPPPPPQKATLNVTADVSGAEVWVNGNKQGVLPKNFTISESGKYEVEVTAPGYKKYRTNKNIELGKEYEVAVHLEKEQTDSELLAAQVKQPSQKPKYQLRSKQITTNNEIDLKLDNNFKPLEYVQNDFRDNGDGTIIDWATGLMWQKSGSSILRYDSDVLFYIKELNRKKFAGHSDWRLPTLDELKSLLTSEKQTNGRFINPIFDKEQCWCWTSDKPSYGMAWLVEFDYGYISYAKNYYYVRAVRSLQ
jgi:uncharacterized caspase-like protein